MIEAGARFQLQLAQNRSTIAPIIRAISVRLGAFSSRDIVGCTMAHRFQVHDQAPS
jgi:hypothetical protein